MLQHYHLNSSPPGLADLDAVHKTHSVLIKHLPGSRQKHRCLQPAHSFTCTAYPKAECSYHYIHVSIKTAM